MASVAGPGVPSTLPHPAPRPPDGYLDAVAGQPLLPVARTAWLTAVDQGWSDPARLHHEGRRAGLLLDAARASMAATLGIPSDGVFLTSSGPTAAATAIAGLVRARAIDRVVISAVESLAVQEPARAHAAEVDVVPVDAVGRLDVAALSRALNRPAAVACVQAANPEVGTRQPLEQVMEVTAAAGVPLLVHAVQVIGRDPIPQYWDVLAASPRDWGGPAGVGLIAVRPTVRWRPDASPDRGWVGGFPDIPAAVAAAAALEYLSPHAAAESARATGLIDRLRARLPGAVTGLTLVGDPVDRLPHILTFTVDDVVGEALVLELDRRGLQVASGSACTSDARLPSQVLPAMGVRADASVRISLPLGCDEASVSRLMSELPDAVRSLAID